MRIEFTPKKFLDVMLLHNITITDLKKMGIDRSYFLPRYKKGSHKIKDLTNDYTKGLNTSTISKIAEILFLNHLAPTKEIAVGCFINDFFEPLVPEDLL